MIHVTKSRTLKRRELEALRTATLRYRKEIAEIAEGNANPQLMAVRKSLAQLVAAIEAALETR
jgi:hypothetical protein